MSLLTTLGLLSLLFVAWFTARAYRNDTPTGQGQSRRQSIIEAWVNIGIGFSINFAANLVLLPLLASCTVPGVWENFMLGWIYTAISIIRQFAIRRWFNDRIQSAARRMAGGRMNQLSIQLHNRQQAWAAIRDQLYPFLANVMQGGKCWVLTVGLRKRTKPQNRRYWGKGVLAQVAEQAAVNGKLYPAEVWHEQFKRQFIGVIELPSGEVVGKSSTALDTAEFSLFCEQVEAYAATDLGVTFYDLEPA